MRPSLGKALTGAQLTEMDSTQRIAFWGDRVITVNIAFDSPSSHETDRTEAGTHVCACVRMYVCAQACTCARAHTHTHTRVFLKLRNFTNSSILKSFLIVCTSLHQVQE